MLLLLACSPTSINADDTGSSEATEVSDDTGATDTGTADTGGAEEGPAEVDHSDDAPLAGLAELSNYDCPDFEKQTSTFWSSDEMRDVTVLIPSTGAKGKSVTFVWHSIGTLPEDFVQTFDLDQMAEDQDTVFVLPEQKPANYLAWDYYIEGGGDDLVLYDDLRTCLSQELEVDLTRVYSWGFSAGAVWTSYLALNRGDTLAAIVAFSGGVVDIVFEYLDPGQNFPALLFHGGKTDVWGISGVYEVEFMGTTIAMADALKEDGHQVALCDHGLGHYVPNEWKTAVTQWLYPNVYGEQQLPAEALDGLGDCGWY